MELYSIFSSQEQKPKRKRLRRHADIDDEDEKKPENVETEIIVIDADDDDEPVQVENDDNDEVEQQEEEGEEEEEEEEEEQNDDDDDDDDDNDNEEDEPMVINIDSDDDDYDDDDDVEVEGGEDTTEEQDFFPGEPRSFIDTAAAPTSSSSSFSSNPSYAVTVDDFPDPHLPFYAPPKLLSHPMIMGQVHVNYNTQFNGTCSQVRRIPISSSSSSLPVLFKVTGTKGSGASSHTESVKLDRARAEAFQKRKKERIASNIQTGMKKPTKKQLSSARAAERAAEKALKEGGKGGKGGAGDFKTASGKVLKPIQAPVTMNPHIVPASFPQPQIGVSIRGGNIISIKPAPSVVPPLLLAARKPAALFSNFRPLVFAPPPPPFTR
jgi:hypothetical protein